MVKRAKWFGYGIFGVFVVVVSLYACFPSEAVRQYVEALASEVEPLLVLKIERIRPALPFGLKADQASFAYRDQPGIVLFKADSFVVMPSFQTLTFRRPTFSFDCSAYGGTIKGVITSNTLGFGGPFRSDMEISDLRLDRYALLKERLKRDCSGTMGGTFTYGWTRNSFLQGAGEGSFSVVDGSIFFAEPFIDLQSMDFRRIDVRMAIKNQEISLDRFDFTGTQMEGKASGTIHLNSFFDRSRLDLTVSVKPSPDFLIEKRELFDAARFLVNRLKEDRFTLNIRGTIAQPRVNFI